MMSLKEPDELVRPIRSLNFKQFCATMGIHEESEDAQEEQEQMIP